MLKLLGVFHGHKIDNEGIWKEKIRKIKNSQVWKTRNLTYKGKVLIQYLIISLIGFKIEARGIPEVYLQEINKMIWNYIWDGKVNQIERKVCCNSKENGGMDMINLIELVESKQIKSIYKILHTKTESWNAIGKFYLTILDAKYMQNNFLTACSDLTGLNINNRMPKFYCTILKAWTNFRSKIIPNGKQQILSCQLFGNKNLQLDKHPLFIPAFSKSRITKIADIWDENSNTFINNHQLLRKLTFKQNWIAEISKIKRAIPKSYITTLQGTDDEE